MGSPTLVYLFAAYTIIWVVLLGYVFFISQQLKDLKAQLRSITRERPTNPPSSKVG